MSAAGGFVGVRVHWLREPNYSHNRGKWYLRWGYHSSLGANTHRLLRAQGIGEIPHQQDIYTSENGNPNVDADYSGFSCSVVDAGV